MTLPRPSHSGLLSAVLACVVVGAVTVAVTVARDRSANASPAGVPPIATEDYGRRLIAETSALLGPDQPNPAMRYSGSRLACGSCHLGTGTTPGTLSLWQTIEHYPRFSARGGRDDGHRRPHQRVHAAQHERPAVAVRQCGDEGHGRLSSLARRPLRGDGRKPTQGGGACGIQDAAIAPPTSMPAAPYSARAARCATAATA